MSVFFRKRLKRWFCCFVLFAFVGCFWLSIVEQTPPAFAAQTVPCATPGKDGPAGTLTGIVNTYYPPAAATNSLNSGGTSVQVGSPLGASTPIGKGDLLLIIQMQDATIISSNTDAYGDGTAGDTQPYGSSPYVVPPSTGASGVLSTNAGKYEYVTVTSVSGNTIDFQGTGPNGGLINSYTNAPATTTKGRSTYQIVRVPQYSSATLGTATAFPWNGSIGGILAYDVTGTLDLTGTIEVSGRGFRGGAGRRLRGGAGSNTDYRTLATVNVNGSKGEGIAGTPRYILQAFNPATGTTTPSIVVDNIAEGYPDGSYGRGAPGNAGGGSTDGRPSSNDQNSGGGGGANGGDGGRGGRAWSLQVPSGGFGGKAFSVATDRLILGGGGGAGTTNDGSYYDAPGPQRTGGDGSYSSGAAGGGMVMIRTNAVSNTGIILARGLAARDVGQDGGGGGGAGGSVLVSTRPGSGNSLADLTVDVSGGNGGWARFDQAHGPGGGGGGGVIITSLPGVTVGSLSGGVGGQTGPTGNLGNFDAAAGTGLVQPIVAGTIPGIKSGAECAASLTVVKTTSTATLNNQPSGATATYTITVTNAADRATATQVTIADNSLPSGFTYAATSTIALSGGATQPAITNPTVGSAAPSWGTFSIPAGGQVAITFTASVATSVAPGTYQNPASVQYLDPGRTTATGTATVTYDPASSTSEDVTIAGSSPKVILVKRITRINNTDLTLVVDDSSTIDDNHPNWVNTAFLKGAIDGGTVQPGDALEYTIYFLSSGTVSAKNAWLCDRVPSHVSLIADAFNAAGSPADRGISFNLGGTIKNLTNVGDGDDGQYFPPGLDPKSLTATIDCGGANTNGAIVVKLGDLPNATNPGTPTNSYGWVRFRGRVK